MDAARVTSRFMGARVVIQDDGTSGRVPDLLIDYPDRQAAEVEVVVDMDPSYGATYAGLLRWYGQIPAELPVPESDRVWFVVPAAGANAKRLRKELPPAILTIAATLDEIPGTMTWIEGIEPGAPEKSDPLRRLGISDIGSRPTEEGENGKVFVYGPRLYRSGDDSWPGVLEWISEFLASPARDDVRRKLGASFSAERHVFVAASFTSPWGAFDGLGNEDAPLPERAPDLPAEITHLWLWTVPPVGRCLAWFPDRGWFEPRDDWATE